MQVFIFRIFKVVQEAWNLMFRKPTGRDEEWSPTAPTARGQLEHENVWRLLLQHAWQPLDQQVICALLCCCKAFEVVVHSSCTGRLSVRLRAQQGCHTTSKQLTDTNQLGKWLIRHHMLVSELTCNCPPDSTLSASDRQQKQGPQALLRPSTLLEAIQKKLLWLFQLGSPACTTPVVPAAAVLGHVGQTLTRLDWQISSSFRPKSLVKSLTALHNLRDLRLVCVDSGSGPASFDPLGPAVQQLQHLTSLRLHHLCTSTTSMKLLPASLLQLEVGPPLPRLYGAAVRAQHLQLQHLARLHTLKLHTVKGCDVLPGGLQVLVAGHCSALPLLPLKHLRQLHLSIDASECLLILLCSMQQLEELHLTFLQDWSLSDTGCKTLQQLPLKTLTCTLPTHQLHRLGTWSGLERLKLRVGPACNSVQEQLAQQLAQQLGQMTALQHLDLVALLPNQHQQREAGCGADHASVATDSMVASPDAGLELVAALSGLPALESLRLEGLCVGGAAAAQLAATVQLTHFELQGCSLACGAPAVDEVSSPKVPAQVPTTACVSIFVETA